MKIPWISALMIIWIFCHTPHVYPGQERKGPQTAGEWSIVGMALGEQNQWPEAVKAFNEAIRLKPDFVEAHNNLGFAYSMQRMFPEAIKAYQRAINMKPDFVASHYNLGFAYAASGRLADAADEFKEATRIQPSWDVAQYQLGFVCTQLGRWADAIEAFKQAASPPPQKEVASNQSESVEGLQQGFLVVALTPERYVTYANLAFAYSKTGRYEEAVQAYRESIKLKPDFPDVHYSLGETYVLMKNREEALKEWEALRLLDKNLAQKLKNLIGRSE